MTSLKDIPTKRELRQHSQMMEDQLAQVEEINTELTTSMEGYKFSESAQYEFCNPAAPGPSGTQQQLSGVHRQRRQVFIMNRYHVWETRIVHLLGLGLQEEPETVMLGMPEMEMLMPEVKPEMQEPEMMEWGMEMEEEDLQDHQIHHRQTMAEQQEEEERLDARGGWKNRNLPHQFNLKNRNRSKENHGKISIRGGYWYKCISKINRKRFLKTKERLIG